jgi:hypothetical protein
MLAGEVDGFLDVGSRSHDFEVRFESDQSPQGLTAMLTVVGNQHADGHGAGFLCDTRAEA